jgi:hypothetical protein
MLGLVALAGERAVDGLGRADDVADAGFDFAGQHADLNVALGDGATGGERRCGNSGSGNEFLHSAVLNS